MANNSVKVSALPVVNAIADTDRIVILRNPSSTPYVATITVDNFANNFTISNTTPANSTSNGISGQISFDSSYVYICTANNIWKRTALTTW